MLFSAARAGNVQAVRQSPSEGIQAAGNGSSTDAMAQIQSADAFQDYGMISDTDGWILIGSRLYWTSSSAADWIEITPALPSSATIYSIKFLDAQMGWILWSNSETDGSLVLQIEHTSDRGKSWDNSLIQALKADDPSVDVEKASMGWLDENTGWVSVKQKTGSNFSVGIIFLTGDGGQTWRRLSLPIGGPVYFVNSQVGWMAGGPGGDQLFKTPDGGKSWQGQPLPGGIAGGQSHSLYPPVFDSPENGLLAVVTLIGSDFQLGFFSTGDGGQSWTPVSSFPLGTRVGWLPLSLLDVRNLVAVVPDSDRIFHMVDGEVQTVFNQDGMSAAIVDLKMLDSNFGWAKWNTAVCTSKDAGDGSANISCNSDPKLIETRDGGITWKSLEIPANISGGLMGRPQAFSTTLAPGDSVNVGKTLLSVGQGFDICTIPTISQLQSWWNNSPYKSVNLYIGGAARACPNTALTAEYVNQMRQQGWTFIPTWVGPQAPCTPYNKRFSYDVNIAFAQGSDEAYFASARLAELGLTYADLSGSVVYYDMEQYSRTNQSCRDAAKAFMNGWVTHLHDLGNLAGVYGGTYCEFGVSNLSDYLTIPHVPDAIWPARWYHNAGEGAYDPTASVWDLGACIPNTVWNNHQRIRQYEGDHSETWGGMTLNSIDNDVLDGVVAVPYFGTPSANFSVSQLASPPLTVQLTIANTAFISSCFWDYGDGQTGTSCAHIHTHAYSLGGTYTVRLTVSSSWGPEHPTSSHTITLKPTTTTTITSDLPDPSAVGQAVTIRYSVAAVTPGSGTPSGNVAVSDGTQSCTGSVAAGSCSIAFGTSGNKALTATYSGDANFTGSISTPATPHTVIAPNPANTTTTITSHLPDPSVVGQAVTVNFSVDVVAPGSGTPTGNVRVSDGTQSCTGSVAAGSCSISFTTAGMKALTATYLGDANFKVSTSAPATAHAVNKANTTTTITSDLPDPSAVGQSVTIRYSVAVVSPGSGTPAGNVTVSDGTQSCTGSVAAGSCSIDFATPGAKTLTATYAGDGNFTGSASGTAAHSVASQTIVYLPLVFQITPPGAFGKTSPADTASGVPTNPTLVWGASSNAVSYEYCFATTSGCTNWKSAGTSTSVALSGLSNSQTYYWQVRAINPGGSTLANSGAYWSFTTAALAPPGAFGKTGPADTATGVATNPALSWETSSGATSYQYCYATTTGCTNWTSAGTNTSVVLSGLNHGQTYHWQVRAFNAGGTTLADNGATWSFTTIAAAPGAFSKSSPANVATGVATNPTFSWGASSGAASYEYCYATSTGCTNWTSTGTNTSVLLSGLNNLQVYYWQVRALNAGGSTLANSGAYWSFTTAPPIPPGAFSKTSPANTANGVTTPPTLSWGTSSGATSYEYCYATTTGCTNWTSAGAATSTVLSGLKYSQVYYWQVRAVNAGGTTLANSGTYWSFTTEQTPPPAAFSKTGPANGATDVPTTPTLSWEASSGATSYQYCYANYNGCTNWVSVGTSTSVPIAGLGNSLPYYWQVRAVNAAGITQANSGTYWSFTTVGPAPGAFSKVSPGNAATSVATNPTLSWSPSNGATSYDYCYATTSGCTDWTSVGISTSVVISGLNNSQVYYWQVRAVNAGGTTLANSGTYWPFTTIVAAPGAFDKVSPEDGAIDVSTTPTLSWNPSSGATSYQYCYSIANGCTNWISVGTSTSVPIAGLANGRTYYWQVRAVNGGRTTLADTGTYWSFTTLAAAPGATSIIGPANAASGATANPILSWGTSNEAISFSDWFIQYRLLRQND
jgi:hypothetical protein